MSQSELYAARLKYLTEHEHEIRFYVKHNCKKCCGKGVINRSIPHRGEWREFCECVKKAVRNEALAAS